MNPSTNVKNELDPLFQVWGDNSSPFPQHRNRMLTDRGIIELLKSPFMKLCPPLSQDELYTRIQPTSIDIRIKNLELLEPLSHQANYPLNIQGKLTIPPNYKAEFSLQDLITTPLITSNTANHRWGGDPRSIMHLETIARSRVYRGGLFTSFGTPYFIAEGMCTQLTNLSPNSVQFEPGESIGQVFLKPQIFFDHYMQVMDPGERPINTSEGDFIRSLDMGVEIRTEATLRHLAKEGYFSLPNKKDLDFEVKKGFIVLHAKSTAKRMRKLDFPLEFKRRKEYEKRGSLYEEIDISNGYTVKEGDMIIVESQESLDLSPNIGMMLHESIQGTMGNINPAHNDAMVQLLKKSPQLGVSYLMSLFASNLSWADPGYHGIMTSSPKLPGVTIKPGDPIGLLRVFYYPNGVETPYGDEKRNSQYQGQKTFQVGARE